MLFEHAAGYALFVVKEVEEIGMLLPQVRINNSSTNMMTFDAGLPIFVDGWGVNLYALSPG